MAEKTENKAIDKVLKDLYTSAGEDFNNKLAVAKEMVKLEMARLKVQENEPGGEGLND